MASDVEKTREQLIAELVKLRHQVGGGGASRVESVTTSAHCLLWETAVTRDHGEFVWDLKFLNEDMAQRILPLDIAESEGYQQAWDRAIVREDFVRIAGNAKRALLEGKSKYAHEYRCIDRNGALIWLYEDVIVEYIEKDRWNLFAVCTDITEQKRAEEELQKQREWLQVTLSSIGDAVIATDTTEVILFMNPVAEALTGWRIEEALGKNVREVFRVINEETRQPVELPIARVLADGIVVGLANHTALIARDGKEISIADSGAPIVGADGEIVGVVMVFQDIHERKQVEQALRESERRYRLLAEGLPVGIVRTDLGGTILYANQYTQQLLGYSQSELAEKNAKDFYVHGEERQILIEKLRKKNSERFEHTLRRKDGREMWIRGITQAIQDEDGSTIEFEGVWEDITEHKVQEVRQQILQEVRGEIWKMQRSEDLQRVLVAVWEGLQKLGVPFQHCSVNVVDESATPVMIQAYNMNLQGQSRQRAITFPGIPVLMQIWQSQQLIYRPDLQQEDLYHERSHLRVPLRAIVDVPFSHGTLAISSAEPNAFSPADIETLQAMARLLSEGFQRQADFLTLERQNEQLKREIAERRRAESEVEREHRIVEVEQAIRVAIASMDEPEDLYQIVEEISEGVRQLGLAHDDCSIQIVNAEGTDFTVLTGQLDDAWLVEIVPFLNTGQRRAERSNAEMHPWVVEVWRSQKSRYDPCTGAKIDSGVDMSLIDVPFSQGTLAVNRRQVDAFDERDVALLERFGRVLSDGFQRFIDINKRKQMDQELIRVERLRAAGLLSAGVSHNLNNILTNILGPAHLLKRKTDDPKLLLEIDDIILSAMRARDLVRELYLSVRTDDGEALTPISVDLVVAQAIQTSRPRWKDEPEARGIAIQMSTRLGGVPSIQGSEAGLHDILINFIFNAVDAMPEGGTITVDTQAVGNRVQIDFSDTGGGMDEQTRLRVFEPFFTTKKDIGTGLGLSTVYNTVKLWQGTIEVYSAPGRGTTFTLCFPIWAQEELAEQKERAIVPLTRSGSILIIDDDEIICRLLSRLLGEQHQVEMATDGVKALDRFAKEKYDVVISDLGMPEMAGDQLIKEMKKLDPKVATVLISGWELLETDPRVTQFDFYLHKPIFDLGEIEDTVSRAIALRDQRDAR